MIDIANLKYEYQHVEDGVPQIALTKGNRGIIHQVHLYSDGDVIYYAIGGGELGVPTSRFDLREGRNRDRLEIYGKHELDLLRSNILEGYTLFDRDELKQIRFLEQILAGVERKLNSQLRNHGLRVSIRG